MQVEEWKEIKNCPGYFVSESGKVKGRRGIVIKTQQYKEHGRYWFFRMPHMNYTKTIHRIVAENFIDNPNNLPEVNHIDGNKNNNHRSNLEWCDRIHNVRHAHRTGLKINKGNTKLFDDLTFSIIKDCFKQNFTNVSIAKYFGCHQSTIAYIRQGARQYYPL